MSQEPRLCTVCGLELPTNSPRGLCPNCLLRAGVESSGGQHLHVRCPHCHNPVEIVDDSPLADLTCPSCHTKISLVDDETATYVHETTVLGRFEVIERIGVGAFGSVWKARDPELDRIVAIKIPRKDQLSANEAEQFLREARAAAQLQHPSIVGVHEVGRDSDRVYIVSDYVSGVTLAEWLTACQPTVQQAAEICAKTAEALHHAHEAGVIHRDLKPSNIMIDDLGEPHIMDFGLAKRDAGEITMTVDGRILGTPAYMSPEQARGEGHQADARSDVYSIGVILFELMTGERPFRGAQRMLLHQVVNDDAPSPRKFNSQAPRDLETICLKCLEKDPGRRYRTAKELADDLRRYLRGESVSARPVGPLQRFGRWSKRNPVVAGLCTLLVLSLFTGTVISTWFAVDNRRKANKLEIALEESDRQRSIAGRNEIRATNSEQQYRLLLYSADMNQVQTLCKQGDSARAKKRLQRHVPLAGQRDLREFTWHYWNSVANPGHVRLDAGGVCGRMAVSSGGSLLYALVGDSMQGTDDLVQVWEVETGSLVRTIGSLPENPKSIAISPNSELLAIGDGDGKVLIIDLAADNKRSVIKAHQKVREVNRYWGCRSVVFAPDGHSLATGGGDRAVRLWDIDTGNMTAEFFSESRVWDVAFSPSGDAVAAVDAAKRLFAWKLASKETIFKQNIGTEALDVEYSPDGTLLATGDTRGQIRFCDARTGRIVRFVGGKHAGNVWRISFSQDGRGLTSIGEDRLVKHWHVDTGRLLHTLSGHAAWINDVVHIPRSSRAATSGRDNTIRLWDLNPENNFCQTVRTKNGVRCIAFAPNGRMFASGGGNHLTLWNAKDMSAILTVEGLHDPEEIWSVSFSHDGQVLAAGDGYGTITIVKTTTGKVANTVSGHEGRVATVRFSPDSRTLVSAGIDGSIRLWDVRTWKQKEVMRTDATFYFPVEFVQGTNCVMTTKNGGLGLWRMDTGERRRWFMKDGFPWAVHPDGTKAAAALPSGEVAILGIRDGQTRQVCEGRAARLENLVFSPSDPILAGAYGDGLVAIWDLRTGDIVSTFQARSQREYRVAFAPDGKSLLASGGDHLTMWRISQEDDVGTLQPENIDGEKQE